MKVTTYSERKVTRIQEMVKYREGRNSWLSSKIERLTKELAKFGGMKERNESELAKCNAALEKAKNRHLTDDSKRG